MLFINWGPQCDFVYELYLQIFIIIKIETEKFSIFINLLKGIISLLNANMNNMIHEKSLHFAKQKNSVRRMTSFSIKKIPQCFA